MIITNLTQSAHGDNKVPCTESAHRGNEPYTVSAHGGNKPYTESDHGGNKPCRVCSCL